MTTMASVPVRFFKPGERVVVRHEHGKARGYVLDVTHCREQPHWSIVRVRFEDASLHPTVWDDYKHEARSPEHCRTFYAAALTSCLVK